MKKRLSDDEFKKWLIEEVEKEDHQILQALSCDSEEDKELVTDEEMDRLFEKMFHFSE